jgi:hypothetical protein
MHLVMTGKGRQEGHLISTTVWRLIRTGRRLLETNMAGRIFGMIRHSEGNINCVK